MANESDNPIGRHGIEPPLTLDEAAKVLRLHPRTLSRLLRLNKVPGVKLGGTWRLSPAKMRDIINGKVPLTGPSRIRPEMFRKGYPSVKQMISNLDMGLTPTGRLGNARRYLLDACKIRGYGCQEESPIQPIQPESSC